MHEQCPQETANAGSARAYLEGSYTERFPNY
jgi:hypothetical protein